MKKYLNPLYIIGIIAIIIFPFALDFFDRYNILFLSEPDTDWLGFIGGYVGGIIGGIITLVVLIYTIKQNNDHLEITLKQNQVFHEDNKKLSILPYFAFELFPIENNYISGKEHIRYNFTFFDLNKPLVKRYNFFITLSNIGTGNAINLEMDNITFAGQTFSTICKAYSKPELKNNYIHCVKDDSFYMNLEIYIYGHSEMTHDLDIFSFDITFRDVIGTKYKQAGMIVLSLNSNLFDFYELSNPIELE